MKGIKTLRFAHFFLSAKTKCFLVNNYNNVMIYCIICWCTLEGNAFNMASSFLAKLIISYVLLLDIMHSNMDKGYSQIFLLFLSLYRWIMYCDNLKEIDIEDNLIGELGGREILEALRSRKEGCCLGFMRCLSII